MFMVLFSVTCRIKGSLDDLVNYENCLITDSESKCSIFHSLAAFSLASYLYPRYYMLMINRQHTNIRNQDVHCTKTTLMYN